MQIFEISANSERLKNWIFDLYKKLFITNALKILSASDYTAFYNNSVNSSDDNKKAGATPQEEYNNSLINTIFERDSSSVSHSISSTSGYNMANGGLSMQNKNSDRTQKQLSRDEEKDSAIFSQVLFEGDDFFKDNANNSKTDTIEDSTCVAAHNLATGDIEGSNGLIDWILVLSATGVGIACLSSMVLVGICLTSAKMSNVYGGYCPSNLYDRVATFSTLGTSIATSTLKRAEVETPVHDVVVHVDSDVVYENAILRTATVYTPNAISAAGELMESMLIRFHYILSGRNEQEADGISVARSSSGDSEDYDYPTYYGASAPGFACTTLLETIMEVKELE